MKLNKEVSQEMLNQIEKARDIAYINKKFCIFQSEAEKKEDVKAQWLVKADTFQATIDEKNQSLKDFAVFLAIVE